MTGELRMKTAKDYIGLINDWEYCYCVKCDTIRYADELTATDQGIKCSVCGSYDLEAPAWISCPQEIRKAGVKCPRGGSGIRKGDKGDEICIYHCAFRCT
jgi:hypothetical protein